MSSGGTQKSLRKALGAIKDTTTVSLAKVNSDYKELDVAIVKATNHYERPAREKHIRAIFAAISATRPRADVAYCIHALARRLSRTHNWARTKDLDTAELLEQLPALQQLLFRVLGCQSQGAALHNFVIRLALSMVASESVKVYQAVSDGTVNLVDKFFEMQRPDALRALDIYRRSGQQAERLSEFYEVCKSLDVGRGERFIKIEQPPASFLQAMEEYVREAPWASTVHKDQVDKPKEVLAIEYKKTPEVQEERPPSPPPSEPEKVEKVEEPIVEPPDLLGLTDPNPVASDLDEKNALALAIVPVADQTSAAAPVQANGTTGWELALVTAPSTNDSATAASKLAGGLDKLTLDSLYDDAIRRSNQNVSYNPWEPAPMSGAMMQQPAHDPFYASNMVAAPHSVQMAAMANQQQAFMLQQQQQQMMMMGPQQQPSNPFGNPYGANVHPYSSGMPVQAYNPYTGLI
ncbi:hypothetical protein REPUB_Repub18cG0071100 [Reevesia pubescens]